MAERPSLSSALPPHLALRYHQIPQLQRDRFEAGLHKVKRWGEGKKPEIYGDITYLPKPQEFSESDLEHTIGMLQMAEVLEKYYALGREVHWDEVRAIAVIHDAGEIRVGDAPYAGPIRASRYWTIRKGYESAAVHNLLSKISDTNLFEWVTTLYDRYMTQDPNDKEAQIANFLDKAQGTLITGPVIFNNFRQLGHNKPSDELMAHVATSLTIFQEKTAAVLHTPISLQASLNFKDYTSSLLRNLDQKAYSGILEVVNLGLDNIFSSVAQSKF